MALNLDIVDYYEGKFGKVAAFTQALHFMQAYMELMRRRLPLEAFEAVEIAKKALQGQADAAELEKARVACRQLLDETDPWGNSTAPESFATKAAMRLLFRDPDDSDTIDVVGYFLKMADGFEGHSVEATALLERYFPE